MESFPFNFMECTKDLKSDTLEEAPVEYIGGFCDGDGRRERAHGHEEGTQRSSGMSWKEHLWRNFFCRIFTWWHGLGRNVEPISRHISVRCQTILLSYSTDQTLPLRPKVGLILIFHNNVCLSSLRLMLLLLHVCIYIDNGPLQQHELSII